MGGCLVASMVPAMEREAVLAVRGRKRPHAGFNLRHFSCP
jgi:hypothetical protein